jgi:hypothetical protein
MRLLEEGCATELAPEAVGTHLVRDGLVMIRDGSIEEVRAFLVGWTVPVSHPHDQIVGLTIITPRSQPGGIDGVAGFTEACLAPHTDRSMQSHPPSLLITVMISPSVSGGHTVLVDGARVLAGLRRSFDAATISGLRLRRVDGATAPIVWTSGGLTKVRFRDDSVAVPYSATGQQEVVDELRNLISMATRSLRLRPGEGYLLHNHRYLHGRSAFSGSRRLARMLAVVNSEHPCSWLNEGFRVAHS